MGKKVVLFLIVAILGMVIVPAVAMGTLVNEYGMRYAGQETCYLCHEVAKGDTVHGRFMKTGLLPAPPEAWSVFRAAGDPPVVPGTKGALFDGGGSYAIDQKWLTVGDLEGGSATEYLFWTGSSDPTVMPWNLVEGLAAEPKAGHPLPIDEGEYIVGAEDPERGLYDVKYGCQRCHTLGSTVPLPSATSTAKVNNPAAVKTITDKTARQWARTSTDTVDTFMTDAAVSYAGASIQCENCHGTGLGPDNASHQHMGTGVEVSTSMEVLANSQVCGQCHGSYTTPSTTLGIYGYTTNLRMADFVDINGVTTKVDASCSSAEGCHSVVNEEDEVTVPRPAGVAQSITYTTIPSSSDAFEAHPTWFWMFPNGSNAKGNHYYYNEWSASAHSYRSALTKDSPDAMAFQAAGNGHYSNAFDPTLSNNCYQCHTGEGYLKSKDAAIAEDFTPKPDNVGHLGQECATCHQGHPSAVGAEDVLRTPDEAGERSAAGLSADNASICEDCHNWQMEVQGLQPAYKPVANLAAHASPSHPEREVLHGRSAMVDVADMGEFMPGVTCEECHMPKTNKGANRYSHGMKPMLPGDAETWMTAAGSAYMGEDSCSTCHGGETRTELQENIDEWQEQSTTLAADLATAITAAKTRSEYSDTAGTPGYALVGRATWNYKVWENDLSEGVHNPRYVRAGLNKALQMAKSVGGSFANIFAAESVVPGGSGFVTGKVVNGDGSAAAGASLVLYANGVATAAKATADAQGAFAFIVAPTATTTYSVVWLRSGDAVTNLSSASLQMAIAKTSSKSTIKASATSVTLGKSVKLTVTVSPADVGGSVKITYRRDTSSSWKTLFTGTLNDASQYIKNYAPNKKGAWYFRGQYAGSDTVANSNSGSVKVTVK
jgi:hypothetical protein